MATKQVERRKARIRRTIKAAGGGRPRLSVFRSSKHIYAQVIDDRKGALNFREMENRYET